MISGETHYLWGRCYRLEVVELDTKKSLVPSAKLKGGKLILTVSTGALTAYKLEVLNEYYRARLKARAPDLINKWSEQIYVTTSSWQV